MLCGVADNSGMHDIAAGMTFRRTEGVWNRCGPRMIVLLLRAFLHSIFCDGCGCVVAWMWQPASAMGARTCPTARTAVQIPRTSTSSRATSLRLDTGRHTCLVQPSKIETVSGRSLCASVIETASV